MSKSFKIFLIIIIALGGIFFVPFIPNSSKDFEYKDIDCPQPETLVRQVGVDGKTYLVDTKTGKKKFLVDTKGYYPINSSKIDPNYYYLSDPSVDLSTNVGCKKEIKQHKFVNLSTILFKKYATSKDHEDDIMQLNDDDFLNANNLEEKLGPPLK